MKISIVITGTYGEENAGNLCASLYDSRAGISDIQKIRSGDNVAKGAKGKYVLFLKGYLIPQKEWFEPMLEILENDDHTGAVGSKVITPDGKIRHAGIILCDFQVLPQRLSPVPIYRNDSSTLDAANQVRYYPAVSGDCMLVRRSLFKTINFDEHLDHEFQYIDLCLKMKELGFKTVFQPNSLLIRPGRKNSRPGLQEQQKSYEIFCKRWSQKIQPDVSIRSKNENYRIDSPQLKNYIVPGQTGVAVNRKLIESESLTQLNRLNEEWLLDGFGMKLLRHQQMQLSKELLLKSIKRSDVSFLELAESYQSLAEISRLMGEKKRSHYYKKALLMEQGHHAFNMAVHHRRNGDYEKSLPYLEQVLEIKDAPAFTLFEACFFLGKHLKALKALQKRETKDSKYHYFRASLYKQLGNFQKAATLFKKVLGMYDYEAAKLKGGAWFHLGEIQYREEAYKDAEESFRNSLSLIPRHGKAKEYLDKMAGS